nr:MAG TPA: hypothetical protein [Caudoviricetes sp.]
MIKANFNSYNAYVTDSLYQWDKDRILSINGLNLDVAPEIHFTNISMQRAVARQSVLSDGVVTVKIPNSFLQVALTIMAYIGIWEGDTFRTVEVVEIPVIPRVKPSDYTLTDDDEEVYSFNRLEALVSDLSSKNDDNTKKIDIVIGRIDTHDSDIEKLKQNISSLEQVDVQIKSDLGKITDYIVEQDDTENGYYRKWASGILEQWTHVSRTGIPINTKYGSTVIYTGQYRWEFPIKFINVINVFCSMFKYSTGGSWGNTFGYTNTAATLIGYDFFSRDGAETTVIDAYAIGRWK